MSDILINGCIDHDWYTEKGAAVYFDGIWYRGWREIVQLPYWALENRLRRWWFRLTHWKQCREMDRWRAQRRSNA